MYNTYKYTHSNIVKHFHSIFISSFNTIAEYKNAQQKNQKKTVRKVFICQLLATLLSLLATLLSAGGGRTYGGHEPRLP